MTPAEWDAWITAHYGELVAPVGIQLYGHDAEDIVQTVLARLRVDQLRLETVGRYLLRACRREALNRRRHDKVKHRVSVSEGDRYATNPDLLHRYRPMAPPRDPPVMLSIACERVLATLPKGPIRQCAWLVYACAWDVKEAARTVGMTPYQFRKHFKARYLVQRAQLARFVREARGGSQ